MLYIRWYVVDVHTWVSKYAYERGRNTVSYINKYMNMIVCGRILCVIIITHKRPLLMEE